MSTHMDDWSRWGEQWRAQPAIDVQRLRDEARRKLRRMRAIVGLELLATTIAVLQAAAMLLQPDLPSRWKWWAGFSLLFVAGLQATFLYLRRGTWQSASDGASGMLALGLRRARAGIRLAKLNAAGLVLELVVTLLAAAPDLNLRHWHEDLQFRVMAIAQVAFNLPFLLATFAFCAWYIRRQRRRIGRLQMLVLDEHRTEPGSGVN